MRRDAGFSLIELMIASAIGLLLLTGLALIFVNTSEANRELQKSAQQIENGRYAIEILSNDLRMAGFYGHLHEMVSIATPAAIPDPCEAASAAELLKALWYPVQGYEGTIDDTVVTADVAPDISTTTCGGFLDAATLKPGSDVLVIRRADTNALAAADIAKTNEFYVQASATNAEVQIGGGGAVGTDKKANGASSAINLSNGAMSGGVPVAAPIRRLHVRVYFVAPCSIGAGAGGRCNGSASEDKIPTLKRLELTSTGTMTIVPLVEGIEYLKVEYGIDDAPGTVNLATQLSGDATVDRFETAPSGTEWQSVIAAKVYVLARNTEVTRGYADTKRYVLGSLAATVQTPARNDEYKRHVYGAAAYMANPAGRREIP